MKKILPLIIFFGYELCIINCAFPQNPLVKMWDYRYGGDSADYLTCFQQTADGGYILGGRSNSGISGNKTQFTRGFDDYWMVKLDSLGTRQWDKDFGGASFDQLYSIQQTLDGGFILGGWSMSGISGDKTQATWCGFDYWIVKTDSLGNKEWDKDFGGADFDLLFSLQQTSDGGYILGGYSYSGISGDKTQPLWGTAGSDYWILKLDSLGNKQWDKDFGGTYDDFLGSIQQTADGGFILGGYSSSGISGDKTQPTWGSTDYWIVKTDSSGIKQWDKDIGGTYDEVLTSLCQTSDEGFILGGWSYSGIGGDKTQPAWGMCDYWVVKTDSLGNKQWDKDFGGTSPEDLFGSVLQTADGGYLIAGNSNSPQSGDKSENNLGISQGWIVKTDSSGNKQWDKTIFTLPEGKVSAYALQSNDGCYVIAKPSYGEIAGYKTQSNWNAFNGPDYWVVKFCDSTFLLPTATAFTDSLLCPGTCTNFTNLSFNATSYQWTFSGALPSSSTDVNPTNICYANPGSYDVQLIATNANGSDTLLLSDYITVYPSPPAQSISQSGDTLFAIAGSSLYQWYFNGNLINGATNYFYVALTSGNYNVVATDSNGCEVEAVINDVIAGLTPPLSKGEGVVIYPNPVKDKFTIHSRWLSGSKFKSETADVEISIYNVMGEKINFPVDRELSASSDPSFDGLTVYCGHLSSGMYFLEISKGEKIYRTRFLKE
jgi:hypothetical protein